MYLNVDGKLYLLADGKELLKLFIEEQKAENAAGIKKWLKKDEKKRGNYDPGVYDVDPLDLQYGFEVWYLHLAGETIKDDTNYEEFETVANELNEHSIRLIEGEQCT